MKAHSREKNRVFKKLMKHPLAVAGFFVLVIFYLVMIFAEFVAPYHYDNEKRDNSFAPPSRIHFFHNGRFTFRPFVYPYNYDFNENYERVYYEERSKPFFIKLFPRGDEVNLWGFLKIKRHLFGLDADDSNCRFYLMGADSRGRDLFSRIVYGSRVSLTVGLFGVLITCILGFIVGGAAGYFGGAVDWILMRVVECFMLIPAFFLMLALRSAFPLNLSSIEVYFLIVIIMAFISWTGFARVIRGMSLSISRRDFVTAAKAMGVNSIVIIFRHVLPHTLSYAIVAITLSIPGYILGESAMSLIGLGIQDPHASWGNLLSSAMDVSDIHYHPWILIPGVFIFLAVMAFNFFGDGLRDAFDPNK